MTDIPDFTLLSADDAAHLMLELNADHLERAVAFFSSEQLQRGVAYLMPQLDPHWQTKVPALLRGLSQRHQLESVGRAIHPVQLIAMLDTCVESPILRDKLQFVLVGLPQTTFEDVLHSVDEMQIRILKDLGPTESIQHHLTLLVHELARLGEDYIIDLEELERRIEGYDIREIQEGDIDSFIHHIEDATIFFHEKLFTVDTALALAWNTTREDLIDRLTQLKENWLRYLQFVVGSPGTPLHPATALYAKLEARLNAIYGRTSDHDGLEDSDPAIEALAALSLWVVEDYWQVGLLPHIDSSKKLDLDPTQASEKERTAYRDQLLSTVQENLSALGLSTVGDLKKAHIYSRNMLIRYIQGHHSSLRL